MAIHLLVQTKTVNERRRSWNSTQLPTDVELTDLSQAITNMATSGEQPIYTPAQLRQYFDYIHVPEHTWPDLESPSPTLPFLSLLIRHQLSHIPFENLDLHYSPHRTVSLDPDHLFHKVITRSAGRGGYCMQNNSFFATILRSLGYNVTSVGARVSADFTSENPTFTGWSHQVNLITLAGQRYLVDVGFGSDGPTFPVPLVEGYTRYLTGTETQPVTSACLTREILGQSTTAAATTTNTANSTDQRLWMYKVRYDHQKSDTETPKFKPKYCFTELEFFPQDFAIMNHHVSTSRTSMFVNTLICMKLLPSEDYTEIIGDVTLWGVEIKERRMGVARPLAEIGSEKARVEALRRFLGVKLASEEVAGIRGLPTEVR